MNPNKLLTRLPILLAQIKAGDNSYELKIKSNNDYIFCISIIKSPRKFAISLQVIMVMEENMIVIRDPQNLLF